MSKNFFLNLIFKNWNEKGRVWNKLHRALQRFDDCTVTYKINNFVCDMPFSFCGTYFSNVYPNYDKQLGRICSYCKKQKKRALNIIDVGANIGDTVLNIGDTENKYLLVEGEKSYSKYIKSNLHDFDYVLEPVFCTEPGANDSKKVVVKEHGTAKIVSNKCGVDLEEKTIDYIIFEHDFKPDVLKIDTDGYDFKVIRGGIQLISLYKPVIYFEWTLEELEMAGDDPLNIFPLLFELGYEDLILFDNFGNCFCMIRSDEISKLKDFIVYTRYEKINYFDICTIHKESDLDIRELYEKLK